MPTYWYLFKNVLAVNREFDFAKNKILIPAGRHVIVDCVDHSWSDLLGTVKLQAGTTLQVERCKLNGLDFNGSQQPQGGHVIVQNSFLNLETECQVCSGPADGRIGQIGQRYCAGYCFACPQHECSLQCSLLCEYYIVLLTRHVGCLVNLALVILCMYIYGRAFSAVALLNALTPLECLNLTYTKYNLVAGAQAFCSCSSYALLRRIW